MKYSEFLEGLDNRLKQYFEEHSEYVCCEAGCSACCEKGDYPVSQIELEYLIQGFIALENELKIKVQENFKNMEKGGACPFLVDKKCSVYDFRPIICRVHGLSYLINNNVVKVPYCVHAGLNYSDVYKDGEIEITPVNENLDIQKVLENFDCGEIRNLYDWINKDFNS